jgi:hypothetical protein
MLHSVMFLVVVLFCVVDFLFSSEIIIIFYVLFTKKQNLIRIACPNNWVLVRCFGHCFAQGESQCKAGQEAEQIIFHLFVLVLFEFVFLLLLSLLWPLFVNIRKQTNNE